MVAGVIFFPRMLDKIRLHALAALPEAYHNNLGLEFDGHCLAFLNVQYANLRERVLSGGSDEEILEWCFEKGRRLNQGDLVVWNTFVSKLGWRDFATPNLEEAKRKHGLTNRDDIVTIPDLIDFDEGRSPETTKTA